MAILETLFTSILSGGATGLLGILVQRWADLKNKEIDLKASRERMAHERELRQIDLDLMAEEWAARTRVAQIEVHGKEAVAESHAFAASFQEPVRFSGAAKSIGQGWALIGLDFLRALVRPGLTVYLCVLTTLVYVQARELLGGVGVELTQASDLMRMIIGNILYLTTTCVLWWFGTRNHQKPPKLK